MALSIKDPDVDKIVRKIASITKQSLTGIIKESLTLYYDKIKEDHYEGTKKKLDVLNSISKRCSNLKIRDERSPDEILGYDDLE